MKLKWHVKPDHVGATRCSSVLLQTGDHLASPKFALRTYAFAGHVQPYHPMQAVLMTGNSQTQFANSSLVIRQISV